MRDRIYKTKEEVLSKGREAIGIPFRDIDETNRLLNGKGGIGTMMEEGWFGYKANSKAEPDFKEAGVELKVTPYIRNSKGISAKERLVCNIINYEQEYNKKFKSSSFWIKNNTILIMSYEYKKDIPKCDFTIDEAILFSFPLKDLIFIEQDWEKIIMKIRAGKAHELSEGDTLYLAACTKGANAKSVRKQPFSDIPAKQRAYSLKQSYMTSILRAYVYGSEQDEHIIKDVSILQNESFENYIINRIKPYLGRTQDSLKSEFNITGNAKNINELLLGKMLGIHGKIAYTEEFKKANIIPKTIRIGSNGNIKESMSFPTFEFKKIIKEDWDNSEFKQYIEQAKFLFIIFRYNDTQELIFDNLIFWNIPNRDLEEVEKVWTKTVNVLREGVILNIKNGRTYNNLPKLSENSVAHVRPHGKDSSDTLQLPDGRYMSKQCFWLNSSYIKQQIEKGKNSLN